MGRYIVGGAALLCCVLIWGCGAKEAQALPAGQAVTEEAEQDGTEEGKSGKEEKDEPETLRFIDAWGERHTMTVNPDVKKHSYDWSCLTNTEEGISYTGDERYHIRRGVDVSEHQARLTGSG